MYTNKTFKLVTVWLSQLHGHAKLSSPFILCEKAKEKTRIYFIPNQSKQKEAYNDQKDTKTNYIHYDQE